jgi:hypothetical protein
MKLLAGADVLKRDAQRGLGEFVQGHTQRKGPGF